MSQMDIIGGLLGVIAVTLMFIGWKIEKYGDRLTGIAKDAADRLTSIEDKIDSISGVADQYDKDAAKDAYERRYGRYDE